MLTWQKAPETTKPNWLVNERGFGVVCFTDETPDSAVNRFKELVIPFLDELDKIVAYYGTPATPEVRAAYRRKDKIVRDLCKQAGVVDT